MNLGVSFHRLAEMELNDAAAKYEAKRAGLGARFLMEVDRCIQFVVQDPEAGLVLIEPVRRRLVSRFPYAVLYTMKPGGVRILAIMHLRRRPFHWVGRS
jgi:toxin ParE1/3/4